MWQILFGIYIIIVILSVLFLWSSLVLAKRADQNGAHRTQPMEHLAMSHKISPADSRALKLPQLSHFSKK